MSTSSPGPGRPTKCTPEIIEKAAEYLQAGATIRIVCDALLINQSTYYDWMSRGEAGEEPFRTFSERAKQASSEGALSCLRYAASGEKGWQGPAWLLERRHGYYKTEVQEVRAAAPGGYDTSTPEGIAKLKADLAALPKGLLREALAEGEDDEG